MIMVTVVTAIGRKSDLFPENMTVREALEDLMPEYAGSINSINGEPLSELYMHSELRQQAKDNRICLTYVPETQQERPLKKEMLCDTAPDTSSANKAKEIQEVISVLAKGAWRKLLKFQPLLYAAMGITLLIISRIEWRQNYRGLFLAVSILLIFSNLTWYFFAEENRKKTEEKADKEQNEEDELPF